MLLQMDKGTDAIATFLWLTPTMPFVHKNSTWGTPIPSYSHKIHIAALFLFNKNI